MAVTLRIHRGYASPERVVLLGTDRLGHLEHEVNDFLVDPGRHVIELGVGPYHGLPTSFEAMDGTLLEFKVVEDPDAILPMFLGGAVKLERVPQAHEHQVGGRRAG